jgi:hypothetical protein
MKFAADATQRRVFLGTAGRQSGHCNRLSRLFGMTEQFWLNLQGAYDVSRVKG